MQETTLHLCSHVGADTVFCPLQGFLGTLEKTLQPWRAIILCWFEAVIISARPPIMLSGLED